jgi:hypothetical protein
VTPITDAKTNLVFSGIAIQPTLTAHQQVISAVDDLALTWGNPTDHDKQSIYDANFAMYRVTAMSLRLFDWAAWLSRGGRLFLARWPVGTDLPATYAEFITHPATRELVTNDAQTDVSRTELVWIPSSFQAISGFFTSATVETLTGLAWRDVDNAGVEDCSLIMINVFPASSTEGTAIEYEETMHFNFVPLQTTQFLYPVQTPVGSQAKIDDLAAIAAEDCLSSDQNQQESFPNAVKRTINRLYKSALRGYKRYQQVAGAIGVIGSAIGGMFGKLDREDGEACHQMAVLAGWSNFSPKRNSLVCEYLSKTLNPRATMLQVLLEHDTRFLRRADVDFELKEIDDSMRRLTLLKSSYTEMRDEVAARGVLVVEEEKDLKDLPPRRSSSQPPR